MRTAARAIPHTGIAQHRRLRGDIALALSTDAGATWSSPTKVNLTPTSDPVGDRQAFLPSVSVGRDGSVAVGYYGFRFNGTDTSADAPLETDYFIARCHTPSPTATHACAGDWVETRITPTSFDLRSAPVGGGLFVGDYTGLTAMDDGFAALFARAGTDADPASVFFARPS